MDGPGRRGGEERQVDVRLLDRAQLVLRLLRGLLEALHRDLVALEIDPGLFLEPAEQELHDAVVEVLAAEERVAVRGLDHEHAVVELEHRDVERAAAEVEDRDAGVTLLVEAVGERRGGRLVDDPQDVEPCDGPRVLRRLPLRVVEVRGHGDDRVPHLFAEVGLGDLLHLLQHHRADLGRRVLLFVDLDPRVAVLCFDDVERHETGRVLHLLVVEPAADQPLDRVERVRRVGDRLPPRDVTDKALAVLREGDDRRCGATAFVVGDDQRIAVLDDRDAAVGGPEVDADRFSHGSLRPSPGDAPGEYTTSTDSRESLSTLTPPASRPVRRPIPGRGRRRSPPSPRAAAGSASGTASARP